MLGMPLLGVVPTIDPEDRHPFHQSGTSHLFVLEIAPLWQNLWVEPTLHLEQVIQNIAVVGDVCCPKGRKTLPRQICLQ